MSLVVPNLNINGYVGGNQTGTVGDYNFHQPVIAASFPNANWTGTATAALASGVLTISNLTAGTTFGQLDGYGSLALNNRILLKDMATVLSGTGKTSVANGIWVITGGTTTSIVASRAEDANAGAIGSIVVWIQNGAAQATTSYVCNLPAAVIATDPITFAQYDVVGTLQPGRGGTGVTSFGGTNTVLYTTAANTLASITTANNSVLVTSAGGVPSMSTTLPTAVQNNIDHNALLNLAGANDAHTQYARLIGRTGGQILVGGTGNGDNLTFTSTSGTAGAVQVTDFFRSDNLDTYTLSAALTIGGTRAGSVSLAATGVITNVQGALRTQQVIDTVSTGTTAMQIGPARTTQVELGATTIPAISRGRMLITNGTGAGTGVDTVAAGIMSVGELTATSIQIGATGKPTLTMDQLRVTSGTGTGAGIDARTAGILAIGGTTATQVQLGSASALTTVMGDLLVTGTTTTTRSEVVNIADSTLFLNDGYTTAAAQTGGLVVNYLPTATNTTVAAGGFTNAANSTVATVGSGTFTAGDLILITGATVLANNGLFCVLSHVTTTLTIYGTGTPPPAVVDFVQNTFTTSAGAAGAIRRINVSIMRASLTGDWQVAKGANSGAIVYSTLATTVNKWSFNLQPNQVIINGSSTVAYFPWDNTNTFGSGAFGPVAVTAGSRLSFWLDAAASPGASTYTVTLRNVTASLNLASITTSGGTAAGIFTAALANIPSADSTLELQVSRTGAGPHARMKDAILLLST